MFSWNCRFITDVQSAAWQRFKTIGHRSHVIAWTRSGRWNCRGRGALAAHGGIWSWGLWPLSCILTVLIVIQKNIFILWAPCGALHQKYTSSFAMCWDERSYVFMDSKIMWHWNTEKDIISMQRRLLCDLDISRGNVVQKHTMDLWTLKHEGSCRVVMSVMCLFTCCTCFKFSMDLIMM